MKNVIFAALPALLLFPQGTHAQTIDCTTVLDCAQVAAEIASTAEAAMAELEARITELETKVATLEGTVARPLRKLRQSMHGSTGLALERLRNFQVQVTYIRKSAPPVHT